LATDLYWRVLLRTVRMATSAAIVAATVGDPLAWVVAPGQRDGADVHAAARLNPGA
jgi:ABC-type spermidine/putrescine transport system permease subunit I